MAGKDACGIVKTHTVLLNSRIRSSENGALKKGDRIDEMEKTKNKTKKQNKTKQKKKKKKKKTPKKKKKKNNNKKQQQQKKTANAASTAGPCPTIGKSSRAPRHWKPDFTASDESTLFNNI